MEIAEYLAALARDGRRIADVADETGPDAEIGTCPGWRMRDLLAHLGGVHRWAAAHVATGRREPYPAEEQEAFFVTVGDGELVDWVRTGHRALVETLSCADPGIDCWSFLPAPSPLSFWSRRQAHETAIHRADAESALGGRPDWTPAFAADGVAELFEGFFARPSGRLRSDPPCVMSVAATDADAAWTIRIEPNGRRIVRGVEPADLAVRGCARDLYLLLWNRCGAERVILDGDPRPLEVWRRNATVRWS